MMKYTSTLIIFAIAFGERQVAGFPYTYPAFSPYMSAIPYHPVEPIMHAPAYQTHMVYHHPYHELQNVAGAAQKESNMLTDVAVRFPLRN